MMKRLFIAIDLPIDIKKEIYKCEEKLAKAITFGVKWVELENLHLTLRFLGETEEEKIDDIKKMMDEISKMFSSFIISLSGLSAFPNLKNPRVLWIDIQKGKREIKEVAEEIEKRVVSLGFKKEEKEFSPHLTLGRVKERIKWKEEFHVEIPYLEFLSEEMTLFESTLTSKGPIYTSLYKSKFTKKV